MATGVERRWCIQRGWWNPQWQCYSECDPWASNITPMSSLFKRQNLTHTHTPPQTAESKFLEEKPWSVQWFLCLLNFEKHRSMELKDTIGLTDYMYTYTQIQTYTKPHGKLRRQRNMQRWKDSSDNIPSAERMEGLSWEQKPACAEMTALQFLGYIILHKFLNFCKLWCLTNWVISICYLIEWL